MKATGSHPRATTTKYASFMPHTEDGNGSEVKQNFSQAVQGEVQVQPTARENSLENPSNMDKGYSVNQGWALILCMGITLKINAMLTCRS